MRRSSRVASPALWATAAVMTLLSLLLAAPASADTVTPTRHCGYGDRYVDLDGERSAVARAPEGYLVAAFCVDSDGRRGGGSELHILSTPQQTTQVRHSEGRRLEGYSVAYVERPAPADPDPKPDDDADDDDADDGDDESNEGRRGGGQGNTSPGAGKSDKGKPKNGTNGTGTASPEAGETAGQQEAERTPATPESKPEPSRSATPEPSEQSDATSQMSALSDGEELRTTPLEEEESAIDDDLLRTVLVAGGIVVVGLIAGGIALLVRLPGQR
ncbi:hypothetical protein J2S40_004817 [Nocardioides luteus]|uniref:Uncharacterized protein n=1 Tax=Nocardioides luteus TaxID=1844 RepID=A0ABQ5T1N1_9ACTN|nr:hypothetical protein [Nocardioides luteus]MDR7313759.1 hypothetical protein [Nocardioides luteus]GGR63578.1 hypothetical protein GCM10010197_33590 [Nocardioides luteus]GLJ70392.1 hypothetical protein GCM10017579_44280 [Nocardioides luteus]